MVLGGCTHRLFPDEDHTMGGAENAERGRIYPNMSPYIPMYPYRTL